MGRVDLVLRRDEAGEPALCVVKRPAANAEPGMRERFEREARIALGLSHPNLARTYEVTTLGGDPCFVQEFVHGITLHTLEARLSSPMPAPVACLIVREVALALAYAHERGIVHRDLAPTNIMVAYDGTVKLIDFGLAKHLAPRSNEPPLTAVGAPVGRKFYQAPEMLEGRPATPLTDIFALGVILWELLARRDFPYSGSGNTNLRAVPDPPSLTNTAVSAELDAIALRAVSYDPSRRTAAAADLARELAPFSSYPLTSFLSDANLDPKEQRALLERDVASAAASLPLLSSNKRSTNWRRFAGPLLLVPAALFGTFFVRWLRPLPTASPAEEAAPRRRALPVSIPAPLPAPTAAPTLPPPPRASAAPDHRHVPRRSIARPIVPPAPAAPPAEETSELIDKAIAAAKARNYEVAESFAALAVKRGGGPKAEELLARIQLDRGSSQ